MRFLKIFISEIKIITILMLNIAWIWIQNLLTPVFWMLSLLFLILIFGVRIFFQILIFGIRFSPFLIVLLFGIGFLLNILEPKSLGTAKSLDDQAHSYFKSGNYIEAEPLFQQVLTIREKALGPDHLDVAMSLNNLAGMYLKTSRYLEAETLFLRALAIFERKLKLNDPNFAATLNNLSIIYTYTARYAEAETLSLRALAIREKMLGSDHPDVAQTLNNLASIYDQTGRYAEAESLFQWALAIRKKALGPNHPVVGITLNNLALLYFKTGRYAEAELLYQQALVIQKKMLGSGHPDVGNTLNNLGLLYSQTGLYAKSESRYMKAYLIFGEALGLDHPNTNQTMSNLAALYKDSGRYAEAEPLLKEALSNDEKKLGVDHPTVAIHLNNLAVLYQQTGRYTEAEPLLRQALEIDKKSLGPGHENVATRLSNLAVLYQDTGRYAEAEPLLQRALEIDERVLGLDHPKIAHTLLNLAILHKETDHYTKADLLYRRALYISQSVKEQRLLWETQISYAALLYTTQHPEAAIFFGKQAVNTLQGLRGNVPRIDKLQRAFTTKVKGAYETLAEWLVEAGRLPEAQQVLDLLKEEEYFKYVRRDASTTGVGGLMTFTAAETPPADQYHTACANLTRLAAERDALLALPTRSPNQDAQLKQLSEQWTTAQQTFEQTLTNIQTALAATRHDKVKQIKKTDGLMSDLKELGKGTVAIYTLVGEKRLYLLLITPTVRHAYPINVSEAEINRSVLAFRQALGDPGLDPRPAAQQFYRWLIQPLEKDLKDSGAKILLWSLDGSLRYLPVAALHDGKQYLAERYSQLVFTPASHARLKDAPKPDWQGLGLGVTQAQPGFQALPAVKTELTAIIRDSETSPGLLPGKLLFDDAFTLEALLRELQQRRPLVHISSHFRFTPGNDSQSYLLLGNGKLSLDRVQAEKTLFAGVDLLTLSACETAIGDMSNATGAEVEGFAVLAQRKGAKAVLATLWSVADASTGQFMQRFYALRQSQRLTKAEALRRGQVEFLRGAAKTTANPDSPPPEGSPTKGLTVHPVGAEPAVPRYTPSPAAPYAHPFYWAPFILLGNGL